MTPEENVALSRYTSLHVGGPARFFVHAKSDTDVITAIQFAKDQQLPYMALGQGSNTVFPDEGYPGVIIHLEDRTLTHSGNTITAGSGVFMRMLVNFALKHGLRGLEELAGIPGTVGGSVRGNAGTWSTETKDVITSIEVIKPDPTPALTTLSTQEASFAYRSSIFKQQPGWIVVRATFSLTPGDATEGEKMVQKDLTDRHVKQPYDAPSAGSFFKNPDKEHGIYSGKLIESCGLKGYRVGGAEISPKHANFIVNRDHAKSADIRAIVQHVQETVFKKHGIKLEPEVHIVS